MKAVIVGAGLSSATVASYLIKSGWEVEVFETRNHIAGNCYDFEDPIKVKVHRYGPHAFHTDNKEVWDYLNQYTKFTNFKLIVNSQIQSGKIIPIPFNHKSQEIVGDWTDSQIIEELFKTYSKKHWGCDWDKLPKSITTRVPKRRDSSLNTYHEDKYQGLPVNGYTKMIEAMFEGCTIHLGCSIDDWKKSRNDLLIYTGSIDTYYNYYLGVLTYRSLRFEFKESNLTPYIQLNKCNNDPETRIIDHSHWYSNTRLRTEKTIISKEYSEEFEVSNMFTDRYYPKSYESNHIYEQYKNIYNPKVIFLGRLGTYKYLDMDDCVAQALAKIKNLLESR